MRGNENFNCNGLFALFTQMREHDSGTERVRGGTLCRVSFTCANVRIGMRWSIC